MDFAGVSPATAASAAIAFVNRHLGRQQTVRLDIYGPVNTEFTPQPASPQGLSAEGPEAPSSPTMVAALNQGRVSPVSSEASETPTEPREVPHVAPFGNVPQGWRSTAPARMVQANLPQDGPVVGLDEIATPCAVDESLLTDEDIFDMMSARARGLPFPPRVEPEVRVYHYPARVTYVPHVERVDEPLRFRSMVTFSETPQVVTTEEIDERAVMSAFLHAPEVRVLSEVVPRNREQNLKVVHKTLTALMNDADPTKFVFAEHLIRLVVKRFGTMPSGFLGELVVIPGELWNDPMLIASRLTPLGMEKLAELLEELVKNDPACKIKNFLMRPEQLLEAQKEKCRQILATTKALRALELEQEYLAIIHAMALGRMEINKRAANTPGVPHRPYRA